MTASEKIRIWKHKAEQYDTVVKLVKPADGGQFRYDVISAIQRVQREKADLIEVLGDVQDWIDEHDELIDAETDDLVDAISDAIQSVSGYPLSEWISVEKQIPDDDIDVLITDGDRVDIGARAFDSWFTYDADGESPVDLRHVTHWQHLPEPPEDLIERRLLVPA